MADRSQRYGMDPEDMRRVIMSIGQPAPARPLILPRLSIPRRTLMLAILLGLVGLLGLTSAHGMVGNGIAAGLVALEGDRAEWGTVQKGLGGPGDIQISPLEKLEMESPAASWQVYNFLQIIPVARAQAAILIPPKSIENTILDEMRREHNPDEPFALTIALALFCLIVLWLHLRERNAAADRNWRNPK